MRGWVPAVLCAALLAACAPAGPAAVVARADGDVVASLPLSEQRRFGLAYRHSVYGVEALEEFAVGVDGRFRLVAVASPSEAVLDYYAVPGSRSLTDGWWRLELEDPPAFRSLPVAATATGQRTLVVDQDRAPLTTATEADRPVVIELKS